MSNSWSRAIRARTIDKKFSQRLSSHVGEQHKRRVTRTATAGVCGRGSIARIRSRGGKVGVVIAGINAATRCALIGQSV
ncbi:MAG TPA: hypothetical protein VIF64_04040, partial [Pyrinomonadaceae bacterium]